MPFRRTCTNKGFTLIELLIVLVILGLLAALIGPNMIRHTDEAKVKATQSQIALYTSTLEAFRLDMGRYPTTDEGLALLVYKPDDAAVGASRWKGPYMPSIAKDGWGNSFQYKAPGEHGDYDLWSYGGDNREGGEGYDADILSPGMAAAKSDTLGAPNTATQKP